MPGLSLQEQGRVYERELGENFTNYYLQRQDHRKGEYPGTTYYDVAPIKHSDYRLKAAISYFSAGLAGAAQFLGTIISLRGDPRDENVLRAARYVALGGAIVAPSVFVADLHTRRRWFNMLRIFKHSSVMSIGTWSLSFFGLFSGMTAASQFLKDMGFPLVGEAFAKLFQVPAALTGAVISLYKGTELESTATPLWADESPLLPALFVSADTANAVAALELAAEFGDARPETIARLEELAVVTGLSRLGLATRVDRLWSRRNSESLFHTGLFRYGVVGAGTILPVAIRLIQLALGRRFRPASVIAAAFTLTGGLLFPAVLLFAGNKSARRAENYFESTKPAAIAAPRVKSNMVQQDREASNEQRRRRSIAWLAAAVGGVAAVLIVVMLRRGR